MNREIHFHEHTFNFKGLVHPKKKKTKHQSLTLMSFQTRKAFIHLQNTNEDILNEIRGISVLPLIVHTTTSLSLQKVHKEIVKLIQVNRVV